MAILTHPMFSGILLQTATLPNAYTQLMPLVVAALLIDAFIVAIWYYIGVLMNNPSIKGSAFGEFYQFIGTAIMIVIIIAALVFVSTAFYSTLGITKLMNQGTISTLCTNIEVTTQLDIIGTQNSLLSGPTASTGNFPGICNLVGNGGQSDITTKLDYPLASTAVVIANLTNQTAANLNYSFTMDAFLGFLSKLSPEMQICVDKPPGAIPCILPEPVAPPIFLMAVKFTPYAGYSLLVKNLTIFGSILNLSVQSFVAQLLLITMFLYMWPYLIFGGLLLRSTFFTRRLGGLLMAIALSGLIVFPLAFSFEYLSLGNGLQVTQASGNPNGLNTTYGFNAITTLPGANNGNYIVNFFVEPNVKTMAMANKCWPINFVGKTLSFVFISGSSSTALLGAEAADILQQLLPLGSVFTATKYIVQIALASSNPSFPLIVSCPPSNAVALFFNMIDSYGMVGVTAFFIPLLNIIITLASVSGLSALFGGDTELAGISRILLGG